MKSNTICIASLLVLISQPLLADTHYVSTTGSDVGDCTTQLSACLTFNYGISKMIGGDVLEIADGTYSGSENNLDKNSNIPAGTNGNYTIIKAANIDANMSHVVITSKFNFAVNSSEASREIHHVEFHGLKIKNNLFKNVSGHHIKVFNTGFEGGPATKNTMVVSIGHNNLSTASNNILFEDVWSYGFGGRYNLMVFNSENIIIRRAVIRHDGGWACDGSNPESGMTIYNSRFVQLQNVIVLDSISDKNTTGGKCQGFMGFYNVSNSAGVTKHENTRTVGSIALNNAVNTGMAWDDFNPIPNALLENSVIYNNGKGITANGTFKDVTIRNVTIAANPDHGIAKFGTNNAYHISNTIIYNNSGNALKNTSVDADVVCYSNGSNNGCTTSNVDPTTSGLLYLPRIETGSFLESAGAGSTQIGARIINKIGASGTLYGEINYDTEQGDALWPWPNENRIAADLCAVRNVGFCVASSLTDYIWSALGTVTPVNIQPMKTPVGIVVNKNLN